MATQEANSLHTDVDGGTVPTRADSTGINICTNWNQAYLRQGGRTLVQNIFIFLPDDTVSWHIHILELELSPQCTL